MDHDEADSNALRKALRADQAAAIDVTQLRCLWATRGATTHRLVEHAGHPGQKVGVMACVYCGGTQQSIALAELDRQDTEQMLAERAATAVGQMRETASQIHAAAQAMDPVDLSQLPCTNPRLAPGTTHHMVDGLGVKRCSYCRHSEYTLVLAERGRRASEALRAAFPAMPAPAATSAPYTPSTSWVRLMVGYAKEMAVDRTLPPEQARAEGYEWFDRWYAAEVQRWTGSPLADEDPLNSSDPLVRLRAKISRLPGTKGGGPIV